MKTDVVFAFLVILSAAVISAALAGKIPGLRPPPPVRSKRLLTGNEIEFFGRLTHALPPGHVLLTQVSMGALMAPVRGLDARAQRLARSRFSQKIIDFVVCQRSDCRVVALIELDDRTHDHARDRDRDRMTERAGYRTLRYNSRSKPDVATLRRELLEAASGSTFT